MTSVQSILDELTAQTDKRTSVFDLRIEGQQNGILTLSGFVLDSSQLDALSRHFPDLELDTASVRILDKGDHPQMHVATNLTGLYEQATFRVPLSSELPYGTNLEILEEQDRWVFVRQEDGYLGWAYRRYLADGFADSASHYVLAPVCELRAEPDPSSAIVTRVVSGTGVILEETSGEWGFVLANKAGWMPLSLLRALDALSQTVETRRKTLLEDSARMTGVPYLWGGMSGNGIDCSGLVRLLHRWIGMDVPRDADMQCNTARPVEPPFEVGDLLFFSESGSRRNITHVGMSLGGWKMVHSSRSRNGVYVDNVQEVDFLKDIYVCAGSFLREA